MDLEQKAIERIQLASDLSLKHYNKPLVCEYSGGKDSDLFTVYTNIIDIETLCQFTGLTDKNGKKIWENDIVNHNGEYAPVKFGMYCSSFDCESYNLGFYVDFPEETFYRKELGYWRRKAEIAGNVFDNPELLQEKSDEQR